jgi:hypothetical protein
MQYLEVFHCNNGCKSAPHCYVIPTLPFLLSSPVCSRTVVSLSVYDLWVNECVNWKLWKVGYSWQTFVKVSSIKFGENPPSGIRADTFGKTDRRGDANRCFSVFLGSRLIKCQSCCPVPCSQYAGTLPSMQNLLSHSSVHKLDATLTPTPVYHRPSNSAPWTYRTTGNTKQMAHSTWPDAARSRLHRWR